MQTITAIIPAHNEQENIERCIKSLLWCDKIQVLWTGNDKTKELAEKLNAEVIKRNTAQEPSFRSVQKNINLAIEHAKTDWVLRVDADEVVTEELRIEIENILRNAISTARLPARQEVEISTQEINTLTQSQNEMNTSSTNYALRPTNYPVAYGIPRKQYFWGGFLDGGDWAYDRLVRLFKPESAKYDPIVEVHEQFKVDGRMGELKHPLLHYSHPTLADAVKKFNLYTTMEARVQTDSFVQAVVKMVFLPPYVFLRWMIWHHGYRDGLRGLVAGSMRGWYDFLLYAKYIELRWLKRGL